MYDRPSIPIASDPFIPRNVHVQSVGKMGEFYNYKLSDEKPTLDQSVSDGYARKLIHGYYASISYIDHLIGQLLSELKSLELDKNTIVVLWGDHGWHLGNDRKWGKHTLFDRSLKSALIVKLPGVNHASKEINTIVETVDIYPTLLEFCGLVKPYELDGRSLVELIETGKSNHQNRAFGFWKNGLSMKTDRYRLTKFFREEEPKIELYDHLLDPEENINIAFDRHKILDSLMPFLENATPKFYFK